MMLVVDNIRCGYGDIEILKGISFVIPKGNIIAIIGANGAGKTTTIRAISRLINLTSGSITFDGVDLSTVQPNQLVKMGLSQIPEGRQVFSELTVDENLEMGGFSIKDKIVLRERIKKCMKNSLI